MWTSIGGAFSREYERTSGKRIETGRFSLLWWQKNGHVMGVVGWDIVKHGVLKEKICGFGR